MALRYAPRPKKFVRYVKPKRRSGRSSSYRGAIDEANKKIDEANRLIDAGKLSEAGKVYSSIKGSSNTQALFQKLETAKKQKQVAAQKAAAKLAAEKRAQQLAAQKVQAKNRLRQKQLVMTRQGLQNVTRQQQIDQALGKNERAKLNAFVTKFGLSTSVIPSKGRFPNKISSGNIERDLYELQKAVSKTKIDKSKANSLLKKIKNEGKLAGLGFTTQFLRDIEAVINTPKTVKQVAQLIKEDPSSIKRLPKNTYNALKKGARDFEILARTSPSEAIGRVGGEVVFLKGASEVLRLLGRGAEITSAKLNPKFLKVKNGKLIINLKNGRNLEIGITGALTKGASSKVDDVLRGAGKGGSSTVTKIFKTGKKGGSKNVTLGIVKKLPKESIPSQVKKAGKKVTAISSQRNALLRGLRRSRSVGKPIPGESSLPSRIRAQLKKFDQGKLSKKEIIKLDRAIRNAPGNPKGLLERSLFADPSGKIRPSRLGITDEGSASIIDIIKGNITFKKNKPEILLFDNVNVQKLPKSLASVKRKLKSGKGLTQKEADNLLKFQLEKSGKFKPIGFLSKESEVTLAPGEIIKKKKKVATTLINGRKVDIVQADVFKPKGSTKKLLNKFEKGTITKKEIRSLDKKLKKQTGIDYGVSNSNYLNKKYVPIKRISSSLSVSPIGRRSGRKLSKTSKTSRTNRPSRTSKTSRPVKLLNRSRKRRATSRSGSSKSSTSKTSRSSRSSGSSGVSQTSKSSTSKTSRSSRSSKSKTSKTSRTIRPSRTSKTSRPVKLLNRSRKRRATSKKKRVGGYNVYARPVKSIRGKKSRKLIKVNKVPLTKTRAKDLRNYMADTSLARTSQLKPTSAKAQKPKLKIPVGYAAKTNKKFRSYKIKKGKRQSLKNGRVIELNKHLLDTLQEKKKISVRKRIKQITRPSRRSNKKSKRR